MQQYDVYLYGMVLITNSFLLNQDYPKPDFYAEVREQFKLPGGETGTCATVLSSLEVSVKVDGNLLGQSTYEPLKAFYAGKSVDLSAMTFDSSYQGLQDYVFIDKHSRTCFGEFQQFFSDPSCKRWNRPNKEDIMKAKVVSLDPFFQEASDEVAQICHELGKKYTTIDCKYDSMIHKYSEVNVISNEFIHNNYAEFKIEELFELYVNHTDGLVIFTFGGREVLFGRKGEEIRRFKPYEVEVVSTLGAGDTFKAGVTYGLLKEMSDEKIVQFASATAGIAITAFPLPLNPPTLSKVYALMEK